MDPIAYAKEAAAKLKKKRESREQKMMSETIENARREARAAYNERVQRRCNQGTNRSHLNVVESNSGNLQVTIVVSVIK
jgi:uncharacterized membrane protein YdbT with pleckstrin-like domain